MWLFGEADSWIVLGLTWINSARHGKKATALRIEKHGRCCHSHIEEGWRLSDTIQEVASVWSKLDQDPDTGDLVPMYSEGQVATK